MSQSACPSLELVPPPAQPPQMLSISLSLEDWARLEALFEVLPSILPAAWERFGKRLQKLIREQIRAELARQDGAALPGEVG